MNAALTLVPATSGASLVEDLSISGMPPLPLVRGVLLKRALDGPYIEGPFEASDMFFF